MKTAPAAEKHAEKKTAAAEKSVAAALAQHAKITADDVVDMMALLDVDGDGEITKSEFKTMYLRTNPMSDRDFERLWKRLDANANGLVEFGELCDFFGVDAELAESGLATRRSLSDDDLLLALQQHSAEVAAVGPPKPPAKPERPAGGIRLVAQEDACDDESARELRLLQCCDAGDATAAERLLHEGVSARVADAATGETPLHKLSRHGARSAIATLLDNLDPEDDDPSGGTSTITFINTPDKEGQPPLFHAAAHGHASLVKALLDQGADIHLESAAGRSLMHVCARHDQREVMTVALEWAKAHGAATMYGISILNLEDGTGATPLHIAATHGSPSLVRAMMAAGADPKLANKAGDAPADIARAAGEVDATRPEVARILEKVAGKRPTLFGRAI